MPELRRILLIARTLHRLGWQNVARVTIYRLQMLTGLFQRLTPPAVGSATGTFFGAVAPIVPPPLIDAEERTAILARADDLLADNLGAMRRELADALEKYNTYRHHKALDGATPTAYIQHTLTQRPKESHLA